jgi:hypothetical protein
MALLNCANFAADTSYNDCVGPVALRGTWRGHSTPPAKTKSPMIRNFLRLVLLTAATTSTGCCLCDHCDDYAGCYYGGAIGAHDLESGRAASAYSGTASPAPPVFVEHE